MTQTRPDSPSPKASTARGRGEPEAASRPPRQAAGDPKTTRGQAPADRNSGMAEGSGAD